MPKKIAAGQSIRVGFTNNPTRRAGEYNRSNIGTNGTMYVAKTTNGHTSEQRMLNNHFNHAKTNLNIQRNSNIADGTHGYTYAVSKK